MMNAQILRPGIYAPVVTPFINDSREEIDLESFKENIFRLAKAGVGIVIGGTLGEGPLLEREERIALIEAAREVIQHERVESNVPLIAGVTGASLKESLQQSIDAANAGADAVIVVAPTYFSFVYGRNRAALKDFFISMADGSPLPVFLYNIPFATGGIDLDADFLIDICEHQNIVLQASLARQLPRVQAIVGRQHGCIGGPANLYPKVCVKIFETTQKAVDTGDFQLFREAQRLQDLVTEADSVINRVGFLGIKTAINIHVKQGLGGRFRKPLTNLSEKSVQDLKEGLTRIFEVENSLQ